MINYNRYCSNPKITAKHDVHGSGIHLKPFDGNTLHNSIIYEVTL